MECKNKCDTSNNWGKWNHLEYHSLFTCIKICDSRKTCESVFKFVPLGDVIMAPRIQSVRFAFITTPSVCNSRSARRDFERQLRAVKFDW